MVYTYQSTNDTGSLHHTTKSLLSYLNTNSKKHNNGNTISVAARILDKENLAHVTAQQNPNFKTHFADVYNGNRKVSCINEMNIEIRRPMYGLSFDRAVRRIENSLSIAAAVPMLGVIPAVIKTAMGVLQATIVAGGELILSPIIGRITKRTTLVVVKHARSNLMHGIGNVTASFFEAIPILGAWLLYDRIMRVQGKIRKFYFSDAQGEKFMRYDTLSKEFENRNISNI